MTMVARCVHVFGSCCYVGCSVVVVVFDDEEWYYSYSSYNDDAAATRHYRPAIARVVIDDDVANAHGTTVLSSPRPAMPCRDAACYDSTFVVRIYWSISISNNDSFLVESHFTSLVAQHC